MKAHQIENWVLSIIDRVKANQPIEDSRIELKSEWIPPEKAARRIAGHANAARGSPILWIVGVDERKGIIGAKREDLANWYSEVQSYFDGLTPQLSDYNIPIEDDTVVALLFETVRAPFVVKNPCFGKEGGGPVALEIPWRDGTRVRSAKRADLLRLLSPLQMLPDIEVISGTLAAQRRNLENGPGFHWALSIELYVVPPGEQRVVIPFHKCESKFRVSENMGWISFSEFHLYPPQRFFPGTGGGTRILSKTIEGTSDEVLIYGPGKLNLRAYLDTPVIEDVRNEAQASVSLLPTNVEAPTLIEIPMSQCTPNEKEKEAHKWCFENTL